ncbi:fibronectin type III domain-containing protein [Flagellimonas maritima]|nr:fibronectin type III domain-containing protein [Allomuricauda aurantiaca]
MKSKLLLTFIIFIGIFRIGISQDLHDDFNAASVSNEINATDGWTGNADISSSVVDPQLGNFSLNIASTASGGRFIDHRFDAVVGQQYTIRIWARIGPYVSGTPSPAFAAWRSLAGFTTTLITSTNWTEYVFNVTANSTRPRIRVYTGNSTTSGTAGNTIFIDNISILASTSDIQAPNAVSDLSSSNTTATGTDLSWSDPGDDVGVTDYEVFWDAVSLGSTGGATNFSVAGLSASTGYDFTVVARDAAGNTSAVSNVESVTTLAGADIQAPNAVSDLSSSNTTATGTDLSWGDPGDDVGVTDYEVFRDAVSLGSTGGATSFSVTGLSASTGYDFTVVARDAAGNASAVSNVESVTTLAGADIQAPNAVSDLSSSNTTATGTDLSWGDPGDDVGVTDYEVFRDAVSLGSTGGATSFSVTGLSASTGYDFTVVARDAAGNASAVSNVESVTTLAGVGIVDYTSENSNLPTVDWQTRDLYASQNIGIGTTDTQGYRLAVAGNMISEGVKVDLQVDWPDFVFEDEYKLPSLKTVEKHITDNGYLIGVPSASEVEKEGIDLGKMDATLLQKIEELTLYTIYQERKINKLQEENEKLESLFQRVTELEKYIKKIDK